VPETAAPVSERILSLMVLTRDEEANLPHLLASARGLGAEIFVVDSGSTDATVAIATAAGCRVVHHAWQNHATQLNWALDTLPIATPWVMRMDADERFTPELVEELRHALQEMPDDVTGLAVKRRVHFWGRWIRYGGYYPIWLLRLWRLGVARCEDRLMGEHMVLAHGKAGTLRHDIIDENHKGIGFWTDKHNRYADHDVQDILARQAASAEGPPGQAGRRRWLRENVYLASPPYLRAFVYWFVRYVLMLGFLDGRPGLVFHFLQGLWYRLLIDAKLEEELRRRRLTNSAGRGG
jgi:glycosyltransferase involved in cell wall biosynthesis